MGNPQTKDTLLKAGRKQCLHMHLLNQKTINPLSFMHQGLWQSSMGSVPFEYVVASRNEILDSCVFYSCFFTFSLLLKKRSEKGAPVDPQAFDLVSYSPSLLLGWQPARILQKRRSSDFPFLFRIKGGSNGIRSAPTKENERVLCEYQELYIQVQMLWKQDSHISQSTLFRQQQDQPKQQEQRTGLD